MLVNQETGFFVGFFFVSAWAVVFQLLMPELKFNKNFISMRFFSCINKKVQQGWEARKPLSKDGEARLAVG